MSSIPQIKAKAELGTVEAAEARFLIARLEATQRILAEREGELLALKGPCCSQACALHYAHSGPCNIQGHLAAGGTQ